MTIALLAIFFGLITILRLRYGLALVALFLPLYLIRFEVAGLPLTFLELMILIVVTVWLIQTALRGQLRRVRLPANWLIGLFVVAATVAIWIAPDTRSALGYWKAYFIEPLLLFVVIVNTVRTSSQRGLIVWALGLGATVVSLVAFTQYAGWVASPGPWIFESPKRVSSVFEYPNAVGLYLTPIIALFLTFLATKNHRWQPWLSGVIVALGVSALFFSFTRGAALGLGAAMIFLGLFSQRKKYIWAAMAFLIVACLAWPASRHAIQSIINVQDTSTDVRVVLWQGTWNLIKAHPLLGAGLGGFPQLYDQYRLIKHTELLLYPHNIFLNFWVEIGLAGLFAFIGLLIRFFWQGFSNLRAQASPALSLGILTAFVALLAYGLVEAPYFKNDLAVQFWMLAGLLFAAKK